VVEKRFCRLPAKEKCLMGFMHISNLYKDQRLLMFREVYALEKVHGTSAHVGWAGGRLSFFSGGENHTRFVDLFDALALDAAFIEMGHDTVTVFGEAYGGKQQGMSKAYGPNLKFVAFDVRIGDSWLAVPQAEDVVKKLGLEFVHYVKVSTDLAALDAERDAPSVQAVRNGITEPQHREGIVIRPLVEMHTNSGERLIAKHKRDEFRETKTPRKVVDASKLQVLQDAERVADEYVVPRRLEHILQKFPTGVNQEHTRVVLNAMLEDVLREGSGEFVDSKLVRQAIFRKTAELFKKHLRANLEAAAQ
jgi:hypothetical protein